uniref:RRM domain-containing protein n=1 Tax=Glossina brevipalpis TaxID=37001 RepID=A0A1A9W6P4_9MUSC
MACTKVFVGSLPTGTKPEELRHLFESYGIVVECDIMNRCGFVHMKNAAMAESAIIALNATEFKGQLIVVEAGRPKERKDSLGQSMVRGTFIGINRGGRVGAMCFARSGLGGNLSGPSDDNSFQGGMNFAGNRGNSQFRGHYGRGRGGNLHGGGRGNMNQSSNNGPGPMRNQSFKSSRPAPYQEHVSAGCSDSYEDRSYSYSGNRNGRSSSNNFASKWRAGNYATTPKANVPSQSDYDNAITQSDWRSNMGPGRSQNYGSRNFRNDNNPSVGFSGNTGSSSNNCNFNSYGHKGTLSRGGGQKDRRGFALPTNQSQQQFPNQSQHGPFERNGGNADENIMYQQRSNASNINVNMSRGRGVNRGAYSGNRGDFSGNRGGFGYGSNSYQQQFPPLGSSRSYNGNRGGGYRNTPHQNVPNRRF